MLIVPSTLVSQSTFPHYSSQSSVLRIPFKFDFQLASSGRNRQYKVHTVKCDIYGMRLYFVSNTKLKTDERRTGQPLPHKMQTACIALSLTAWASAGCRTFRVDARQGNRRNIGKFQGRHVVIHRPCIFSACTAAQILDLVFL